MIAEKMAAAGFDPGDKVQREEFMATRLKKIRLKPENRLTAKRTRPTCRVGHTGRFFVMKWLGGLPSSTRNRRRLHDKARTKCTQEQTLRIVAFITEATPGYLRPARPTGDAPS